MIALIRVNRRPCKEEQNAQPDETLKTELLHLQQPITNARYDQDANQVQYDSLAHHTVDR